MADRLPVAKDRVVTHFPKAYKPEISPYRSVDYDPLVKNACYKDRPRATNAGVKLCKAVVVGDVAVGKTSMVNRFCHNVFDKDYKATIGVDFEVEKFSVLSTPFTLQLWDTAGQERFKCIAASYYRGANVIIVAFDLCDINTLTAARTWYHEAFASADDPIVFLVGMKKDMLSSAAYRSTEVEALQLAQDIGAEYWPTSSKTDENVKDFFFRVVALAFNHIVSTEITGSTKEVMKGIGNNLISVKTKDVYEERKKKFKCRLL